MAELYLLNALTELGISELQKKVYLSLLRQLGNSITKLISETKMSRGTFYKTLEELSKFGLCSKNSRGNWQAIEPGFIFAKLKAKQVNLNKIASDLENHLEDYATLYSEKNKNNFAKIYSGRKEIQEIAAKLAIDLKSDYIGFGDSSIFEELIGEEIESFWMNERRNKNLNLRLLLQDKKYVEFCNLTDQKDFRETRFLESGFNIPGYFNILENVAYCWFSGSSRAVVIYDEVFVYSLKSMFEIMWEKSVIILI